MTQAKQAEPPAPPPSPRFLIGQDRRGNWVVQDQNAVRGGLFVNRDAALRFVRSENERRPEAVIMISGIFELDMTRKPTAAPYQQNAADTPRLRRVA